MSINILIIEPDHYLGLVEKNIVHNLKDKFLNDISEMKKIYNINIETDAFYKGLPIDNNFKLEKLIDGDNIIFYITEKRKKKKEKVIPIIPSNNDMIQMFQELLNNMTNSTTLNTNYEFFIPNTNTLSNNISDTHQINYTEDNEESVVNESEIDAPLDNEESVVNESEIDAPLDNEESVVNESEINEPEDNSIHDESEIDAPDNNSNLSVSTNTIDIINNLNSIIGTIDNSYNIYSEQQVQLESMGFVDSVRNNEALIVTNGNVELAINYLLQNI